MSFSQSDIFFVKIHYIIEVSLLGQYFLYYVHGILYYILHYVPVYVYDSSMFPVLLWLFSFGNKNKLSE